MQRRWLALFAALLLATGEAVDITITDTAPPTTPTSTFAQWQTLKTTTLGAPSVGGWPRMSFRAPRQLAAAPQPLGGAFVLTNQSIWWATLQFPEDGGAPYVFEQRVDIALPDVLVDASCSLQATSRVGTSNEVTLLVASGTHGVLWAVSCVHASPGGVACSMSGTVALPASMGPVMTAIASSDTAGTWVGSTHGVCACDAALATCAMVDAVPASLEAVSVSVWGPWVFVSTPRQLFRYNARADTWRADWVGGVIDAAIATSAFEVSPNPSTPPGLWVGNAVAATRVAASHPDSDASWWTFDRIGALPGNPGAAPHSPWVGLPASNITALAAGPNPGDMWVGTATGAALYTAADVGTTGGAWRFFSGPRWLPTSSGAALSGVVCIASDVRGNAYVATDSGGFAILFADPWTLEDKAAYYAAQMPLFDRLGLFVGASLGAWGDLSSLEPAPPGPSDGLWSGQFLSSACLAFAVTGDPDAKAAALRAWEGTQLLEQVTGLPGYVARSLVSSNETAPAGRGWHPSPVLPGWWFSGDTSSDSVSGNILAYALVPLLGDATATAQAHALLERVLTRIVDDGLVYVGVNNTETTWGRWAPDILNDDPAWFDERGTNSAEILAFLLTASKQTGNPRFLAAAETLRDAHGYTQNMLNTRMTAFNDINFSDDELIFISYFLIHLSSPSDTWRDALRASLAQTWPLVRGERNPWFTSIAWAIDRSLVTDEDVAHATWTLQRWPLDPVVWPSATAQRIDWVPNQLELRTSQGLQSQHVMAPDERARARWNANPYQVGDSDTGGGMDAYAPGDWLVAYWTCRWVGMCPSPSSHP